MSNDWDATVQLQEAVGELTRLEAEIDRLENSEAAAWGLIANAYGGNWDLASEASGWRAAAERWRDDWLLTRRLIAAGPE